MTGRIKMTVWFSAFLLLFLAVAWAGQLFQASRRAFDIGDYSYVDIQAAAAEYRKNDTNEALVLLIKALCFRREVLGKREWEEDLLAYGRELYTRAREETVDLQTVDDEKVMLQVLSVLRDMGAHR